MPVRGKSQNNLWGSITCGQNPDFKELMAGPGGQIPKTEPKTVFEHRHGLDHDCAIGGLWARSGVTTGLWKGEFETEVCTLRKFLKRGFSGRPVTTSTSASPPLVSSAMTALPRPASCP